MILCFKLFIVDLKSVPYIDQTACKALIEWIGSVDDKAHLAIVAHDGSKSLSEQTVVFHHKLLYVFFFRQSKRNAESP